MRLRVVNKQASKEQPFLEGETSLQKAGTGSGFVYKIENGNAYVATNHHVVEGAEKIEVNLPGGKTEEATLLGSDPRLDLAVLRIDSDNVNETVKLGDSSNLQIGQTAIAVGNPLGFLEGSVTKGIISNVDESMPVDINKDKQPDWEAHVLQTDASINPGNSGGPLLNAKDVIVSIDEQNISSSVDLREYLYRQTKSGEKVKVTYFAMEAKKPLP